MSEPTPQTFTIKYKPYLTRGFSGKTLTGVRRTLPWKTELDRNITVMKDRISRLLYDCHKNVL